VLLAILFLLHYDGLRPAFWWHALLVMNFWRAITGAQLLNHLWAVAVEFQFYLFWPLVIFLVPRRRLRLVVTLLAVSAPCFRFAAWYAGGGQPVITLLPFGNLDALSAGALLALRKTPAGDPPPSAYSRAAAWEPGSAGIPAGQACHIAYFRAGMWGSGSAGIPAGQACHIAYSRAGMWGGLALLAGVALVRVFALADYPAQAVVLGSALALLYFHVLQRALQGFRGPLGNLLSHRATCHLGMISYSTYLFHPLIGRLFLWLHAAYGLPWPESPWLQLPLLIAASIAAAQLSWMFLEKPLARLKSRF
jgi:peptidoglycan/LPS O-acetylase OafA/YrhL